MTTGEKIQYYRKKLSLSQEELGQKLLVSRQTVSLWENGQTAPTIDNLVRLKEIFGVSVDELLGCETETAENNEEKTDTPTPSESYKFDLTKADISSAFKSIIKMLFMPSLKTVLVLIGLLAVYFWIDAPDIAIGIFAGILAIIVISNVHQFFNYRRMWKKRTPDFEVSEYEYKVFGDYFTIDLTVDGELISTEKIKFSDVQKVYDGSEFLLIIIHGAIYILKKSCLISNSAFYIAMYNPEKSGDKKAIKKLTIATNILCALSLGILVFLIAVSNGEFTLRHFWLPVVLMPVPLALTVLGYKLKRLNAKYKKNIVIGTVVLTALCIDFAVNYIISNDSIYEYDPVTYFTDNTSIALPEGDNIVDSYTVEFADDTQPGCGGYLYLMSRVIFEDYSVSEFENSLKHDTRWLNEFPEELKEWVYPLDFDEGHKTADVMMLYNFHTGEYNTVPNEDDYNIFMAAFYHTEENTLEIFEFDIENTQNNGTQEETELTQLEKAFYTKIKSEILTWNEPEIYAISFFVYPNGAYTYRGFDNVAEWAISYNTESDCNGAGAFSEERWNFAFWRQNMTYIINPDNPDKLIEALFDWYEEQGITNIGEENEDEMYDEDMNYIGKGPAGYYELLQMAANVAKKLHEDGVIKEQFGKDIPIIVHELEYYDLIYDITKEANPNGQADVFLKAYEMDFGYNEV